MKKIVLPTDFSEGARRASEYAVHLFADEPVTYILVNSYVIPATSPEILISISDMLPQNSADGLDEEKNFMMERYPEKASHFEVRSLQGYLENALQNLVQEENIHMIIMGTTGASGFRKFFFGSNAAGVLQHVSIPVLTVPFTAPLEKPLKIAMALDDDFYPDASVLHPLLDITDRLACRLQPVHINTRATANALNGHPIPVKNTTSPMEVLGNRVSTIQAESVLQGLQNFVHDNRIDLLAMIHHKRSFLNKLFQSSHTRKMAMVSEIPLLVLPD